MVYNLLLHRKFTIYMFNVNDINIQYKFNININCRHEIMKQQNWNEFCINIIIIRTLVLNGIFLVCKD